MTQEKFSTGAVRSAAVNIGYHMISPIAMRRLAAAYALGAKNYAPYNWLKGIPATNLWDHLMDHLLNFLRGDKAEDHLGHALWNLVALVHFSETRPELFEGMPPECVAALQKIKEEIPSDKPTSSSTYASIPVPNINPRDVHSILRDAGSLLLDPLHMVTSSKLPTFAEYTKLHPNDFKTKTTPAPSVVSSEKPFSCCGIKHGFNDCTCILSKGHEGACRSRTEVKDGHRHWCVWQSKDGIYEHHISYESYPLMPKNPSATHNPIVDPLIIAETMRSIAEQARKKFFAEYTKIDIVDLLNRFQTPTPQSEGPTTTTTPAPEPIRPSGSLICSWEHNGKEWVHMCKGPCKMDGAKVVKISLSPSQSVPQPKTNHRIETHVNASTGEKFYVDTVTGIRYQVYTDHLGEKYLINMDKLTAYAWPADQPLQILHPDALRSTDPLPTSQEWGRITRNYISTILQERDKAREDLGYTKQHIRTLEAELGKLRKSNRSLQEAHAKLKRQSSPIKLTHMSRSEFEKYLSKLPAKPGVYMMSFSLDSNVPPRWIELDPTVKPAICGPYWATKPIQKFLESEMIKVSDGIILYRQEDGQVLAMRPLPAKPKNPA